MTIVALDTITDKVLNYRPLPKAMTGRQTKKALTTLELCAGGGAPIISNT